MAEPVIIEDTRDDGERRRVERRRNARLGDLTLPELRRILITTSLGAVVLLLFLWMVRAVVIAAILGLIIGFYIRPLHLRILKRTHRPTLSAILTLLGVILPILIVLAYSYSELSDVAGYVASHQDEIAHKVNEAVRRLPFLKGSNFSDTAGKMVIDATAYGTRLPLLLRSVLAGFSVAATIFMFTAFYILLEADTIGAYLVSKVPPRYSELRHALEVNVRGVLYGAIYSTLLTQTLKSLIILGMNLVFGVPLAGALAVVSFIIGFFPIVGSWSVYIPVAIWLVIFRDAMPQAIAMVVIGTLVNTVFISTYLRPKIAADRSRVLNFYWMFVALITGVYTFGLAGILLGPILIGLLKAILDTVTARSSWQLIDLEDEELTVPTPST
ncbi:MAG TPA: AI-2E family transporter [Gemmatimonadaceae bacterium]|jgi:predicted PurR-regulated permease PerM|nr:AI-2E family transporter [Gemmatimonadaceae bacterium]